MGDVFPGKTRGPRAEKQPYVPDPLPKGVQSMGDFLPGMTKPDRPVRKRQEPGRWDGVGEKPSPNAKPCSCNHVNRDGVVIVRSNLKTMSLAIALKADDDIVRKMIGREVLKSFDGVE